MLSSLKDPIWTASRCALGEGLTNPFGNVTTLESFHLGCNLFESGKREWGVISKTPAEVVGEKIFGPIVDKLSQIGSQVIVAIGSAIQIPKKMAQSFSLLSVIPGAFGELLGPFESSLPEIIHHLEETIEVNKDNIEFNSCKSILKRNLNNESVKKCNLINYYIDLGLNYNKKGENKKALSSFRAARKIIEEDLGGNPIELVQYFNNMGSVLLDLNEKNMGLEYFQEAFKLLNQLKETHLLVAITIHNLATNLFNLEKYEESIFYQRKLIEVLKKNHGENSIGVGLAHASLGEAYLFLEKDEEALLQLEKTFQILKEDGCRDPSIILPTLDKMGIVLRNLGRDEEALVYDERARALRKKTPGSNPSRCA